MALQLPRKALSGEPKWTQLVTKGLKCPNGSLGTSKSSFSFMCDTYHKLSGGPNQTPASFMIHFMACFDMI